MDDISYIDDLMEGRKSHPGSQCRKKSGMISNPGVKRKLHDMELEFFLKKNNTPLIQTNPKPET